MVNRVVRPTLLPNRRNGWPRRWDEGPEGLPARPLAHPAANEFDLRGRKLVFAGISRRHADGRNIGCGAPHDLALFGIARHDGEASLGKGDACAAFDIEAQLRFPVGSVRAVAGETLVGEEGSDVAVELDFLAGGCGGNEAPADTK